MKNISGYLLAIACSLLIVNTSYTQCIPDSEGCIDIDEPGQICPDTLPHAFEGTYYEESLTIRPPSEALIGETLIVLHKMIIDSIGNLPIGMNYKVNSRDLYPDSAYCVSIFGTPTSAGTNTLYIKIIPFIEFNTQIFEMPPIIDDTSVTVTIHPKKELLTNRKNSLDGIECMPNPFRGQTKIAFSSALLEVATLQVYTIQGRLVYQEKLQPSTGKNHFTFDGVNLNTGVYLYRIFNSHKSYSGKIAKIE